MFNNVVRTTTQSYRISISEEEIITKANDFGCLLNNQDFHYSHGWFYKFKLRHNLTSRRICCEANSVDMIVVIEERKRLSNIFLL